MHVLVAFVPAKLHALSDDRTDIQGAGYVETSPFVYSAYYSHEIKDSMSNEISLMRLIAESLNSI